MADNYMHYVKWPAQVDGMKNQICDEAGKPGIAFVYGTRQSLIVKVANIDPSGKTTVIDFVFDEKDFSCIYPDGTFKPDQYLTKSEALKILQKTLEAY